MIRDLSRELTMENKDFIAMLKRKIKKGTIHPSVVITLLHYGYGRPVEKVALTDPDGNALEQNRAIAEEFRRKVEGLIRESLAAGEVVDIPKSDITSLPLPPRDQT